MSLEFELPLFSFIFIALLTAVYFIKKKVPLVENKMYGAILLASLIAAAVDTFVHLVSAYNTLNALNTSYYLIIDYCNKIISTMFVIIFSCLLSYTLLISYKKVMKNYKKLFIFITCFTILFYIATCFTTVDIIEVGNVRNVVGSTIIMGYIIVALLILINVILTIINFKKGDKRYYAIFIILIMLIVLYILSLIFKGLIIYDVIMALLCYIMYFTIEDPDIKMIEQLNIARDTAEKANEAKTDFLSNMSHEIRTPLNAIVGFSNLLLEDESVPDCAKDEVKDIVMASDNLLEIVNGILDISKIEANKLEIVNTEYSLKKVCDELISLSRGRLGDKPIEFKTKIDPSMPKVLYGDSTRIKQICVNILTNAIKYTKEGWIEFKISGVIKNNICRLIISVEDTGIGIKKENIDKLFNKFERIDLEDNITIEGTGLGLAITKKLVELMNGKIVVQSVFGKGSKFTVSIDQRIVKNPTIKLDEEINSEEKTIINNKRVLLVDDNKINLKVAEKLLESYGIDTESVDSGFVAIEKIQNNEKYDMILLDDMMPKMSGVETLKKLKEIPGFNITTIALTANALTGMKEKYLSEGFDDYLAKPINKDELNRIINKYLNND
ncbi:MAG: ATP-binding protein [Bacilli bacterium]